MPNRSLKTCPLTFRIKSLLSSMFLNVGLYLYFSNSAALSALTFDWSRWTAKFGCNAFIYLWSIGLFELYFLEFFVFGFSGIFSSFISSSWIFCLFAGISDFDLSDKKCGLNPPVGTCVVDTFCFVLRLLYTETT